MALDSRASVEMEKPCDGTYSFVLQLLLWGTTLVRTEQMYSVFLQVLPIQKAISMYSLL